MSTLFRTLTLLALVWFADSAAASPASLGREIIDVFPVQSWTSISQIAPAPRPDPAASVEDVAPKQTEPLPPDPPLNPFELLGELRDSNTSIFVVGAFGSDETYIVCGKGCKVSGAILPGQELAGGYRVKKISPAGLQIVAQDGVAYELPVSGLEQ